MKTKIIIVSIISLFFQSVNTANASVFNFVNLIITLPDSVSITGSEVGTGVRKCTIKGSIDAAPGTTIPLRAGASVIIYDSLLTRLNSAREAASVEGLTHLDLIFGENCSPVPGTVKPPYMWGINVFMVPCDSRCSVDAPVNINFVSSTYLPTPTPTPVSTPSSKPILVVPVDVQQKIENISTRIEVQESRLTKPLQIRDISSLKLSLNEYIKFFNGEPNRFGLYNPEQKMNYVNILESSFEKPLAALEKMKIEIKCTKGKLTKKVTAVNPKCPSGYK